MNKEDEAINFINFLLSRQFFIIVLLIIMFVALHPLVLQLVERIKVSSIYDKMQKIANLQINYEIANNRFADDLKLLDTKIKDNKDSYLTGDSAKIGQYTLQLARKGILAFPEKNDYAVYYDYKTSVFACAPQEHFICKNLAKMTQDICEEAGFEWSNKIHSCYPDEKEMCLALGLPWDNKSDTIFCGYRNIPDMKIYEKSSCIATTPSGCKGSIVYENGTCEGSSSFACLESNLQGGNCIAKGETACHSVQVNKDSSCIVNEDYSGYYGCQNSIINKGGTCLATGSNTLACNKAIINNGGKCIGYALQSCNNATVFAGGICEADSSTSCNNITVKNGGKCIANMPNTCIGNYDKGACCHGEYCPLDIPKCY